MNIQDEFDYIRHLEEVNAQLLEACEAIEWVEMGTLEDETPYIICPSCENEKITGHTSNCRLDAAIAAAKGSIE